MNFHFRFFEWYKIFCIIRFSIVSKVLFIFPLILVKTWKRQTAVICQINFWQNLSFYRLVSKQSFEANTYFDIRSGINLVHSVTRHTAGFPVQVVALYENRMIGEAPDPDVPLPNIVELDAFADVQSRLLRGIVAMHVGQLAQTEAGHVGRVGVAINGDLRVGAGHFEGFPDLRAKKEETGRKGSLIRSGGGKRP